MSLGSISECYGISSGLAGRVAFSVTLPLAWIHRLQVVPTGYLVATYRLYLLYIIARPMTDEIETQ